MALFHTILHPTDFDPPSKEAFRVARGLAKSLGAKLIAFHIAPPPAVLAPDGKVIVDPKNPNIVYHIKNIPTDPDESTSIFVNVRPNAQLFRSDFGGAPGTWNLVTTLAGGGLFGPRYVPFAVDPVNTDRIVLGRFSRAIGLF